MAKTKIDSASRQFELWCALGVVAILGAVAVAMESFAASGSATASAIVIEPVAISTQSDLVFSASGTNMTRVMILSAAGIGGGMSGAPSSGAATSPASLTISGDGNTTYAITVPSTMTVAQTGATQTVTVTTDVSSGLGSGKSQTVLIGGTLVAGLSKAQGSYAGTLMVVIEYN